MLLFAVAFGLCFGRDLSVVHELAHHGPKNCSHDALTRSGYLKNHAGKYLTCTNERCNWDAFSLENTQLFHQEPTKKSKTTDHQHKKHSESLLKIYSTVGSPTGQCLNIYKSEGGTKKLRMASCKLEGSKKWVLCDGFLGFDKFHECVQSNAGIDKCKDSHAVIKLIAPKCKMTSTTIDKLVCLSPISGGACSATGFAAGSMAAADSQSDCNACDAAAGSQQQCSFSFAYTTQNTITNTWSNSDTWSTTVSFSVQENFIFGDATQGFSFTFSDTLTTGQAKTISKTMQDTTGCTVILEAGTRESARAKYLIGTIHADFNATVTRHWSCNTGEKKSTSKVDTVTIKISNVPTQKIIGSCTTQKHKCNSGGSTTTPGWLPNGGR